jgi:hypothetical protein
MQKQVVCKGTVVLYGDKAARMNCLTLILEDLTSFKTPITGNQSKRCNIAEDLKLQELKAPFTTFESLAGGGLRSTGVALYFYRENCEINSFSS